jgi:hypothetical protein
VLLGGVIGLFSAWWLDRQRRVQEIADLKASIYAEIADRAARCVSDYLVPWRDRKVTGGKPLSAEWVGKFRPMNPVVFTAIAGKLGRFDAEALIAVTQFYFRLEALSQALDSLRAECERRENLSELLSVKPGDDGRVAVIVTRLRSCFEPALRALKSLDVPKAAEVDKEVARIYPHLRNSRLTLREALREHAPAEPA